MVLICISFLMCLMLYFRGPMVDWKDKKRNLVLLILDPVFGKVEKTTFI